MWTPLKCGPHWNVDSSVHMWTWQYVDMSICPHFICELHLGITSIILMLGICALTLFLCTQNFKANEVNRFIIRARARLHACKTCFQRFGPNSLSFYPIKLFFSFFWEPTKKPTRWASLFVNNMASSAIAGVFTYARITFLKALHPWIFIGSWLFKIISRTAQHN